MKVDRHSAGGNMITRPITALVPWLACAGGFAPESPAFSGPRTNAIACRHGGAPTALSSSVNDDASGFHYDQEPRGTSYMSQLSKKDLWERRQVRHGAAQSKDQCGPWNRSGKDTFET